MEDNENSTLSRIEQRKKVFEQMKESTLDLSDTFYSDDIPQFEVPETDAEFDINEFGEIERPAKR